MKTEDLKPGYYQFGNKGALWSNETHIAHNGSPTTLCDTPMLSTNWANLEGHKEIGCKDCLAIYNGTKPTAKEWQQVMDLAKKEIGMPQEININHLEYYVDYFTNVSQPIVWGANYVLASEPYTHDSHDRPLSIGFYKKKDRAYTVITREILFNNLIS